MKITGIYSIRVDVDIPEDEVKKLKEVYYSCYGPSECKARFSEAITKYCARSRPLLMDGWLENVYNNDNDTWEGII